MKSVQATDVPAQSTAGTPPQVVVSAARIRWPGVGMQLPPHADWIKPGRS